ncbi:hypothetical protein DFH09DRAFT_867340, partial [Mycena vulgaris]
ITSVFSIIAVCSDNLPPTMAQQGNKISLELGEHAYKLIEVQPLPNVSKGSRQGSSFAIVNAMKSLIRL